MRKLKILHAADLHLDSPFEGLSAGKAAIRRKEQRELLARLADLAVTERVDLVLLAGDLLDSGNTFYETGEELIRALLVAIDGKYKLIVLGGNDDSIDATWTMIIAIFDCHLALCVRTQIRHFYPFAPNVCQHSQDTMCQVQSQRHIVLCFVGGITKHHSLITSPLAHRVVAFHTTIDIRTLFMNGREDSARVCFKHILAFRVSYSTDRLPGYFRQIHIGLRFDFSGQYDLTGSDQRLACHFRLGIKRQEMIQHSITNLISHLIGVAFTYRF